MAWILINERKLTLEEVAKTNVESISDVRENQVLTFCKDWLAGKEFITFYTSGSTGTPKEIKASRLQLKASAHLTISTLGLAKGQTSLVCLDTRYIAGTMMLIRSLEADMNMIVVPPTSNPLKSIHSTIDFTALVPLQVETILQTGQQGDLEKIRKIIIGGASLNIKTEKIISNFKNDIYTTYGMTETFSHIALRKLTGADKHDYFQTLGDTHVTLDSRECLVIHAPHLSKEALVTNDLAELIDEKKFKWIGRIDDVINTGGVKVIPEKVESIIAGIFNQLNLNNRFFITGIPDSILGQGIALIIEGNPFEKGIQESLVHNVREKLSRFDVPRSIHFIKKFIETDTHKINKLRTKSLLSITK
jgi:O-succinylbenzoic acid--CoA ligase